MNGSAWFFPPALIFFAGAVLVPFLPGRIKQAFLLLVPLASLAVLALNAPFTGASDFAFTIGGANLELVRIDRLAFIFLAAFHLIAALGTLFGLRHGDDLQHVAALFYAGASIGVVAAGDLITAFCFWEIMTVSSAALIWARRTPRARAAGMRYLLLQICSGLLFFSGIIFISHSGASFSMAAMQRGDPGYWLIFLAVGIKAAFPGLHTWLTDAYPEATPSGAVWLSAFTTKTAIYLLVRLFPGEPALVPIGAIMVCFPIIYAVIENDLRRTLAYSMINQVGFMVVGVGIGTQLALDGTVAHAFNDIFFKGLLFMSMGAVLERTGRSGGADLGGIARSMPWTCAFCIIGACSISALPLFSGFVSKSMIMSAIAAEGMVGLWILMLIASAGVLKHAGIKIPYFAFFAHDRGLRPQEAPWNQLAAMGFAALICIFLGAFPHAWLYPMLPGAAVGYEPYDAAHVLTQLQLLFFAALAFALLLITKIYPPEIPSLNLDADFFPRKLARLGLHLTRTVISEAFAMTARIFEETLPARLGRWFRPRNAGAARDIADANEAPSAAARRARLGYEPQVQVRRSAYEKTSAAVGIGMALLIFLYVVALLFGWQT